MFLREAKGTKYRVKVPVKPIKKGEEFAEEYTESQRPIIHATRAGEKYQSREEMIIDFVVNLKRSVVAVSKSVGLCIDDVQKSLFEAAIKKFNDLEFEGSNVMDMLQVIIYSIELYYIFVFWQIKLST